MELERRLHKMVNQIAPATAAETEMVRAHLDNLTKPKGSLGQLETIALRLARIFGDPPPRLQRRTIYVCAGDHGVAAQGVSAYPSEVTAQMCRNFASGGGAINAISCSVGATAVAVDFGVAADLSDVPGVVQCKIGYGTRNLAIEPAMSPREAIQAIESGFQLIEGATPLPDLVGLGEMGIGNSTAASALTALLTEATVVHVVGRGTGIDDARLAAKVVMVEQALQRLPGPVSPLEALWQVGGFEIAGLVGIALGAAASRRPVVTDGFIATAAALVAVRLCPTVAEYLFASHHSVEPGHAVLLDALGLRPIMDLDMRLGEGTGAALAMPVLDAAASILRDMATFASAEVSTKTEA